MWWCRDEIRMLTRSSFCAWWDICRNVLICGDEIFLLTRCLRLSDACGDEILLWWRGVCGDEILPCKNVVVTTSYLWWRDVFWWRFFFKRDSCGDEMSLVTRFLSLFCNEIFVVTNYFWWRDLLGDEISFL